jgi:hypothetical protein
VSHAVWCNNYEAGHATDELTAISVAVGKAVLHYCHDHGTGALAGAVGLAFQAGSCEIIVPPHGAFTFTLTRPWTSPAALDQSASGHATPPDPAPAQAPSDQTQPDQATPANSSSAKTSARAGIQPPV